MAVMELWRRRDLEGTVKPEYIDGNFFTQDSVGNLVGVKCYKDGAEVALTGSVTGYCVLPSGETVSVAGTRSGNQASILVPQSALAYTGPLGITLKLIDGNTITTLMRIIVVVYRSKTDTVITPSSQIITDWANQISAALQEVEDASAAQDVKIADLKSAIEVENLLPIGLPKNSSGYVNRGVKFEIAEDGTITMTGTATGGDASLDLVATSDSFTLPAGTYTVSGVSGGSTSTYYLYVATVSGVKWNCVNGAITNTIPSEQHIRATLFVKSGQTVNGVVVRPMIVKGNIDQSFKSPVLKDELLYDALKQVLPNVVIPLAYYSGGNYKENGITYTLNSDMSITANGTATSDSTYYFVHYDQGILIPAGYYCLSGCEGGSNTTYELFLADGTNLFHNYDDVCRLKIASDAVYRLAFSVKRGVTVNNLIVKPMLEKGVVSHDYVPSRIMNENMYSSLELLSSENLMPDKNYSRPSYYRFGVHFLQNDDMSITMNGTATKDAYYMFISGNQAKEIEPGIYTLSGCDGGGMDSYRLCFKTYNDGVIRSCFDGVPAVIEIEETSMYSIFIIVKAGVTVENVTIRPMLEKGYIAHAFKSPKALTQLISVGGEMAERMKHVFRIMRQPWTALKDLDYFEQQGFSTEDNIYAGIPYSSAFNIGGDVLHQRNLATFFSAVKNPASYVYQPLVTRKGVQVQCNYGIICTSFTGWMNCQPMQVNANELETYGFQFYDYSGPECLEVGDILWRSGHTVMIYDILADQTDLKPLYICLIQSTTTTWMPMNLYTISQFEEILQVNGGAYKLGRYPNRQIRSLEGLRYATDVIPVMGDRTYFYPGDDVYLYVADSNVSTIYYKKDGESSFRSVSKASLPTTIINDTTVYNVKSLTTDLGKYIITTNPSNYTKCEIMRISTGAIGVNGNTVTLSGYSDGLEPVWYQVMGITSSGGYPITSKGMIDNDVFQITLPSSSTYVGYLVRVNYETGYGQAMMESEEIMY